MATEKERELMREIMDLAFEVNNQQQEINCSVDIRAHGIELRIHASDHASDIDGSWIYYPVSPAYFSDDIFTEEKYEATCEEFRLELRKYHKDYDADGIRLEVAK